MAGQYIAFDKNILDLSQVVHYQKVLTYMSVVMHFRLRTGKDLDFTFTGEACKCVPDIERMVYEYCGLSYEIAKTASNPE